MRYLLIISLLLGLAAPLSAQTWSALGGGSNQSVRILQTDTMNNLLYAGGEFVVIGGDSANCLAVWDGISWQEVDEGALTCGNPVTEMTLFRGDLWVEGSVVPPHNLATWDGTTLSAVPGTENVAVFGLDPIGDDRLYVTGAFDSIGGIAANKIAVFDGSSWSAIDTTTWKGTAIFAATEYKGEIYIGGNFRNDSLDIQELAKWNGSAWQQVGGVRISGTFTDVRAFVEFQGDLYIAGAFQESNGIPANGLARWDGSDWKPLDGGLGGFTFTRVDAMEIVDERLFVVGSFLTAGGVSAFNIASWDGQRWCAVSDSFGNSVVDVARYNNELVIATGITINTDSVFYVASRPAIPFGDTCSVPLSLPTLDVQVYSLPVMPNPVYNQLTLDLTSLAPGRITIGISGLHGRSVYQKTTQTGQRLVVDFEHVSSGVYFLNAFSNNRTYTAKIIKE